MTKKSYCQLAFEENTRRVCKGAHDVEHELRTKPNGDYADGRVYAAWCGWKDCWEFCMGDQSKVGEGE